MRSIVVRLLAVLIVVGFAANFGSCAFACDSGSDHEDGVEVTHCIAHCACHSLSLVSQNPAFVTADLSRQPYRFFDEQVQLPLSVADIFNPPKV